jgi:predicted nucleic acid-binding protein
VALICDTGVLYAAIDEFDAHHAACAALVADPPEELAVPAPVVVELEWLVTSRMSYDQFDGFLQSVEIGAVDVADLEPGDWARVRELCRRYEDLPLGLVDASIVALAERLDERRIATLDHRHFSIVRPRHAARLTLVP